MSPHHPEITAATIDWDESNLPRSREFGDIYFSPEDGLAETRHVFIDGNQLNERFSQVTAGSHFVIAETGFGTGLNFLTAADLWLKQATADACLHFISFELYPLTLTDLRRALSRWKTHFPILIEELCDQYPIFLRGPHRLQLAGGRIQLTLYLGDVSEGIEALDFHADAWFLDGFSPTCNPQMWQLTVLGRLAGHSHTGTTLATFSAAGDMRRSLAGSGWQVSRQRGFGRKRHMVTATFSDSSERAPERHPRAKSILIVGGGIAGACLAYELSRHNVQVTLWEARERVGEGASGNAQGALYIKPGIQWSPHSQLHGLAFLYALRFYRQIAAVPDSLLHLTGLLDLATTEKEKIRQAKLVESGGYPAGLLQLCSASEASRIAGIPLPHPGLYLPQAGWTNPGELVRHLLQTSRIQVCSGHPLESLTACQDTDGARWLAGSGETKALFDAVLLAPGTLSDALAKRLSHLNLTLPFKPIRGQITRFHDEHLASSLQVPLCGDGYVLPNSDESGQWCGATFQPGQDSEACRADDDSENVQRLAVLTAQDSESPAPEVLGQRCAVRSSLPDYMPVSGLITNNATNQAPLGILSGLGSKGLTLAPILARALCDQLLGSPSPLSRDLNQRIGALRYAAKEPR